MRDQILDPYKTTGKIIILLHMSILVFLGNKLEGEYYEQHCSMTPPNLFMFRHVNSLQETNKLSVVLGVLFQTTLNKKCLRTALLWVITQRVMVISYRPDGTTYRAPSFGFLHSMRNNPEERNSQLLRVGSPKLTQAISRSHVCSSETYNEVHSHTIQLTFMHHASYI
jgi:hypothetical protein